MSAGDIDNMSAYVTSAIRQQMRREAILGLLARCEAEGMPAVCLSEAYVTVPKERRWRLDALAVNPGVQAVGVPAEATVQIAQAGAVTERAGAAQVAYLAGLEPSIVFTDVVMPPEADVRPI